MTKLAVSSRQWDNVPFLGSAWRHYSARHAALRSGSNEPRMYDGLGSTRQLINHTDQSVTDAYEYEAFGNLMSSSGSTPNPYQYVGSLGYYQTGTSLVHLGERYYLPEAGRFLSTDPWKGGRSPYGYAESNPVGLVDPAGLDPTCGPWRDDPQPCMVGYFKYTKEWLWHRVGERIISLRPPMCECAYRHEYWEFGWYRKYMHVVRDCCEDGRKFQQEDWQYRGVGKTRLRMIKTGETRWVRGALVTTNVGFACVCQPPAP